MAECVSGLSDGGCLAAYTDSEQTINTIIYTVKAGNRADLAVWSTGQLPSALDPVGLLHAITVPAGTTGNPAKLTYTPNGRLIFGDTSATIRVGF